jgi:hypothetical protein
MSCHLPVQLVVVDASIDFAFHVWRYLGRSIRIKSWGKPLERSFWIWTDPGIEPLPMRTADGHYEIWWVPGDFRLERNLSAVLNSLGVGPRLFVIDTRGEPVRSHKDLGNDGERLSRMAVEFLLARGEALDRMILVSSYETGVIDPWRLRISPKSPDTLDFLERKAEALAVTSRPIMATQGCKDLFHILVTGAGFEISSDATGGFGLPPTAELLTDMGPPFGGGDLAFKSPRKKLPCPCLNDDEESKPLQDISDNGDLDAWWDFLLERALRKPINSTPSFASRDELKMLVSVRERELREAFRQVILKYDWGHLNQALEAARQDWHAWLTTNYTRFADRAIALVEAWEGENEKGNWQIIATSIEALSLSREILHGSGLRGGRQASVLRYLFKLHGDIGQLQTMATAGQDKEFFSSLSVPVDSLHQVYAAAETQLSHSFRNSKKGTRLVWHIVGHGLQDRLLCRLIARVCILARKSKVSSGRMPRGSQAVSSRTLPPPSSISRGSLGRAAFRKPAKMAGSKTGW